MTESASTVFEKYQVRKTKKQKNAFIEYLSELANKNGYSVRVEKGMLGAKNIIVGEPEKAKVIYTAHYDTCARLPLPNFITPKCFLIYLLYQILLVAVIFLLPLFIVGFTLGALASLIGADEFILALAPIISYVMLIALIFLIAVGPANKRTANDNTSGVTTLINIMLKMPVEKRGNAAYVFFDLEEAGLFGSAGYASKHKKELKNVLLLNFDCVSDGEHMIFALRKGAKKYEGALRAAFADTPDVKVEILSKGVFYPSDQINFPAGVGVASLKRSRLFGILYMNRIHTRRDVIYREENISFLVNGAIRLTEQPI